MNAKRNFYTRMEIELKSQFCGTFHTFFFEILFFNDLENLKCFWGEFVVSSKCLQN